MVTMTGTQLWRVAAAAAVLCVACDAQQSCDNSNACGSMQMCGADKLCHEATDHTMRVQGLSACSDLGTEDVLQEALDYAIGLPVEVRFKMECSSGCIVHGRTMPGFLPRTPAQVQQMLASGLDRQGLVASSILVARDASFEYVTTASSDMTATPVIGPVTTVACDSTLDKNTTAKALVVDGACHATACKGDTRLTVLREDNQLPRAVCALPDPQAEADKEVTQTIVVAVVCTVLGLLCCGLLAMFFTRRCCCKSRDEEEFDDFKRAASMRKEAECTGSFASQGSPSMASFRLPATASPSFSTNAPTPRNGPRVAPAEASFLTAASGETSPRKPGKDVVLKHNPVDAAFGKMVLEEAVSEADGSDAEDDLGYTMSAVQGNGPACGCCLRRFALEEGRIDFDELLMKGERGLYIGVGRQYLLVGKTDSTLYCLGCKGPGADAELPLNVHRQVSTREELEQVVGKTMGVVREKTIGDQAVIASSVAALFKGLPKGAVPYTVTKAENGEVAGPGVVTGCRQKATRWFYSVKKPLLSWLCVLTPMIAAWFWYFFNHTQGPAFDLLGYWLPIAKGCANAIKVGNATLLLFGCRHTMTFFQNMRWYEALFGQTENLHVWVGVIVTVLSLVHTGCASRNYYMLIHRYGQNAEDLLAKQLPFITGLVCLVFLIGPVVVARYYVATRKLYNFFFQTHMGLIIYLIVLAVHTKPSERPRLYAPEGQLDGKSDTIWWTLPFLLLYLAEMLYRRMWRSKHPLKVNRNLTRIYPVGKKGGRILRLVMSRAGDEALDSYKPGQYVHIQDEKVSRWEWHPFTIARVTETDLELQIKCDGDWVSELADRVEDSLVQRREMHIGVDGPYAAPAMSYSSFSTMVLVGAGIGVTPFLAVVQELLKSKARRSRTGARTKVHFIYLVADLEAVSTVEDVIRGMEEVRTGSIDFTIQICLTGGAVKKLSSADYCLSAKGAPPAKKDAAAPAKHVDFDMFQLVQHYTVATKQHDFLTHLPVATQFGRPSWREIFTDLGITNTSTEVGVFCCGNPMLVADLENECKEFNSTYAEFDFRPEIF